MAELEFDKNADGIAVIRINRPDAMGAFTYPMIDALAAALGECQHDADIRAVILTGTGKGFCTGTDIKAMAARGAESAWDRKARLHDIIHQIPRLLEDFDKPYIAAINGAAYGAGLGLALMADIRFAARSAKMAETYIKLGIVAGDGSAWYLPRLIGLPRALDMLWSGRAVTAEEAERIGLITAAVDDDKLMEHSLDYARKLAAGPPLAMRLMKRAVYQGLHQSLRASLDLVSSHTAILGTTEDGREAVLALNERRPGSYKGS